MPADAVPAVVTLHLWRAPAGRRAATLAGVPADWLRLRAALRRPGGPTFAKLLGTGDGRTMTLRDATPDRWAVLATWPQPAAARAFDADRLVRRWDARAAERWRAQLVPVASHGRWSRREPFGRPSPARRTGPVAALTRARLRPTRMRTFWRDVPAVSADLAGRPGLRLAIGVGEAPIGVQGTFSVWESADALAGFAYRGAAHRQVIERTAQVGWYAEELFARFAVLAATGTVDGVDPLATAREVGDGAAAAGGVARPPGGGR